MSAFRLSLRWRIISAIVLTGLVTALVSGIAYQFQISQTFADLSRANYEAISANIERRATDGHLSPLVANRIQDFFAQLAVDPPHPVIHNVLTESLSVVTVIALIAAGIGAVIGFLLTRRFVRPLRQLQLASQVVAEGDFPAHVPESKDEIGQVSAAFNAMVTKLHAVEDQRARLLADVAHELRTPLASIQGHIEALRDKLPRAIAHPDTVYAIVLDDVAALDRMVGSLRKWLSAQSMIEQLSLQPLAVAPILERTAARFQPHASSAAIVLDWHVARGTPVHLVADPAALQHCIDNLIENALRYTPTGGHIRLRADKGQKPGTMILAVSDSGCGIAREHWPFLFDRFYRVDPSRSRDTGGTGLGLAVVKSLVDAQHGRIWLDSTIGAGTTFFIQLPTSDSL